MDLFVSIFKVLSPQASGAGLASEVVAVFQGRERHSSYLRHRSRKTKFLDQSESEAGRFKKEKESVLEGRT